MEVLDYVVSSIAVTFLPQREGPQSLSGEAFSQFMNRPIPNRSPDGSLVVTSNRDQIEVILSPGKVDVRDLSGDPDRAKLKLPTVLIRMWEQLQQTEVLSYGINFIVQVEMQDPQNWMGETFLRPDLNEKLAVQPRSDAVHLSFDEADTTRLIRLQVPDASHILVNSNDSRAITVIPDVQELQDNLETQRNKLETLLTNLGIVAE